MITLIAFGVGENDAELLTREFCPIFDAIDLGNLPHYGMYMKLSVDGAASLPFSAHSVK